jgi:xylitol oxidase
MPDQLMNWAKNITFSAHRAHHPTSVVELRRVVAGAEHIRALGSGHSFNTIADSAGDLVSLAALPPLMTIDTERSTVTVAAGLRYGEVASYLNAHGYALHNMGSLPHISVAGACATGTHGSGPKNGNLATAVRGLDLVTATGDLISLDADSDGFLGSVVALGMLGIVTSVTLDIVPAFDVEQYVYEDLPLPQLYEHFDEIVNAAYSVSLFTTWRESRIEQVWVKRRIDEPANTKPGWMGLRAAEVDLHPVPGIDAASTTQQLGVPGPWHERLPHFRLGFTPSSGDELQTEYFVARESAAAALDAVDAIRHQFSPLLQVCELRTIAADQLWLSPSYGRDSFAIHFTWIKDIDAVTPAVAGLEQQLAPYDARPHWGKVYTTAPETIARLYERLPAFAALAHGYDPTGKFRNEFVDRYIPKR